jgi:hypothetical protein
MPAGTFRESTEKSKAAYMVDLSNQKDAHCDGYPDSRLSREILHKYKYAVAPKSLLLQLIRSLASIVLGIA